VDTTEICELQVRSQLEYYLVVSGATTQIFLLGVATVISILSRVATIVYQLQVAFNIFCAILNHQHSTFFFGGSFRWDATTILFLARGFKCDFSVTNEIATVIYYFK
jgi:hypothetical protein